MISQSLCIAINLAKAKNQERHKSWTSLSWRLAGRLSIMPAMLTLQRLGDLDLLLCGIEDEFEENKSKDAIEHTSIFNYQMMLSEAWVITCYEIIRTVRQRANEGAPDLTDISDLPQFKSLLLDLELLRMPIAKFEIPKDRTLKQPLPLGPFKPDGNIIADYEYSKDDPLRLHHMPWGLGARGSITWLVLDHSTPREYWIERRNLADRALALNDEIVPAGILESQRAATPLKDGV